MTASIRTRPGIRYPALEGPDDAFSPSERFPEYQFDALASTPNPVYAMVRDLFAQLGLDKSRFQTPSWNPLASYVPRGSRVFVLCNFVHHRRSQENPYTFSAKCIHASVLRALIDYVLLATGDEGHVAFGNSPLQGADWQDVLSATGADRVAAFYASRGLPVRAMDLRLFVTDRSPLGHVRSVERRDDANGIRLDLGESSLLAATTDEGRRRAPFRISDYDPRSIEAYHAGDSHRYVIHRTVLESNVIISLSKLKTHEKVGITCGLKGFVGSVGHKDCLAHHRFGTPRIGGDEYPDSHRFLHPYSRYLDWINRREPDRPLQRVHQVIARNLGRVIRRLGLITTGAWHGNDTCWRMALDLARILHYADAEGVLRDSPQRRHLSLIDGIVAGEKNGPLIPRPVDAGALIFGDDVAFIDRIACRLMGFDPARIPLVREAFALAPFPITDCGADEERECVVDGEPRMESQLEPVLGRPFLASSGWAEHLQGGDRKVRP